LGGERYLRVQRGARAADRRLRVAAAATVEVHRRPEAFIDFFDFVEIGLALLEKRQLVRGQACDRIAGTGSPEAHAWIARVEGREGLRGSFTLKQKSCCY